MTFSVASERDFDFLSQDYAALFERSSATAFQHPLWLDALYRQLAPSLKAEPLVITVRAQRDGRLAMVLPLVRRRRRALTMVEFADLGVSDYAALVCDPSERDAIRSDGNVRRLIREGLGRFDLLRIPKLREDAPDHHAGLLASLLAPASTSLMDTSAHSVPLSGPFSEWRAENMNPSLCRELDQKRRKLGRKGRVQFRHLADANAIGAAFERMRLLREPRFEDRERTDILADAAGLSFYTRIAVEGAAVSLARTYVLELDDQVIAAAFGLSHRGRFMVLLSAFDQSYRKLSLGNLLFEDIVRDCLERGDDTFDLTIGDEAYKQHFGTRPTRVSVLLVSGSLAGSVAALALRQPWLERVTKKLAQARPSS